MKTDKPEFETAAQIIDRIRRETAADNRKALLQAAAIFLLMAMGAVIFFLLWI